MSVPRTPYIRITAIVNRDAGSPAAPAELLRRRGIASVKIVSGRTVLLRERTGVLGRLMPGGTLVGVPADVLSFLVKTDQEAAALQIVIETFKLGIAGRGSVYSESVSVPGADGLYAGNAIAKAEGKPAATLRTGLAGICCIVQRGEADAIARIILESGIASPMVTFGEGTGLRDKLGLLRITIPAEKDVVTLVTDEDDADAVTDMLVDAGKLDQPGRGFIYLYPVRQGLIDPRVSIGASHHVASLDQVVLAIDEITGSTQWRRRTLDKHDSVSRVSRQYLAGLQDLSVHCDEGRAGELVAAAMAAGAAGATISKAKYVGASGCTAANTPSPARETASLIVSENQADQIISALQAAGLGDERTHGQVQVRRVPKACTYLGKPGRKS